MEYPIKPFGKQSRWVGDRGFMRNPSQEFYVHTGGIGSALAPPNLWTATSGTTGVIVSAPVFTIGKSGLSFTIDSTDSILAEYQSNHIHNLVNIGDKIIMRREIAFGTVAECGVFIGLSETDTSVFNATIGSSPNNCIGVHKTAAGTAFNFVMRSASGTAYTQALTLPAAVTADTRYWIEIEVRKTSESSTSGEVIVRIGTNVYPDSDPITQGTGRQWTITGQAIPTSAAGLRETMALQFGTGNATVFYTFGGACYSYSNRGQNLN